MASKKFIETPLISEELLKLFSPISANVDIDKLIGFVQLAQDFYIVPILGTPLVEELQEQIENGTLTNENKALILKIAPSLSLWTNYLSVRSLSYSFTEKGLTKENSENSASLDRKEIADLIYDIKDKADMATELLVRYLCSCSELYPLWRPSDIHCCDKFTENDGSVTVNQEWQTSIYFPDKIKNCGCKCKQ